METPDDATGNNPTGADYAISNQSRTNAVDPVTDIIASVRPSTLTAVSTFSQDDGDPDLAVNEQDIRPNGRRITALCVCIPVTIVTLLIVCSGTLAAAIVSWHQYEVIRLHDAWIENECVVVEKRAVKSPEGNKWRAECVVRDFGLRNASETVVAFWGRTDRYTETEQDARDRLRDVHRVGSRTSCWVKYGAPHSVSMVQIKHPRQAREDIFLNMAWGSSFFAAVSGFLLLTLAVNFIQRALVHAVRGRHPVVTQENDATDGTNIAPKKNPCLSSVQARHIITEYGEVLSGEKLPSDWTCSICLDDNGEANRVRIVVLPCFHRFHSRCIRRWIRRGSATCPLCNWDLQSLFSEDGNPLDAKGESILSPITASPRRGSSVVLDLSRPTH